MTDSVVFTPTQTLGLPGMPKCPAVTHVQMQMVHFPPSAQTSVLGQEAGLGHQMQARHSLYPEETSPGTVTLHPPLPGPCVE